MSRFITDFIAYMQSKYKSSELYDRYEKGNLLKFLLPSARGNYEIFTNLNISLNIDTLFRNLKNQMVSK